MNLSLFAATMQTMQLCTMEEPIKKEYIQCVVNISTELNYHANKMLQDFQSAINYAEKIKSIRDVEDNAISIQTMIETCKDFFTNINIKFCKNYNVWLRRYLNSLEPNTDVATNVDQLQGLDFMSQRPERLILNRVSGSSKNLNYNVIVIEDDDDDIEIVNEIVYKNEPIGREKNSIVLKDVDPQDKVVENNCTKPKDKVKNKSEEHHSSCISDLKMSKEIEKLIDLDSLEKTKKRIYSSTESINISALKNKSKKKTFKKARIILSECESSSDSSDSSMKSSNNDENDSDNLEMYSLDEISDIDEERCKQDLLNSDDDDNDEDENDDNDKDDDASNPKCDVLKIRKTKKDFKIFDPEEEYSCDTDDVRKNKNDWTKDNLLFMKFDDNKVQRKKERKLLIEEEKYRSRCDTSSSDNEKISNSEEKNNLNGNLNCSSTSSSSSSSSETESDVEYIGSFQEEKKDTEQTNKDSDVIMESSLDLSETMVTNCVNRHKTRGRRNIRLIFDDEHITGVTKQAGKEEENRVQQLTIRKQQLETVFAEKKYNEKGLLVLDIDLNTKEEIVIVDNGLVKHLKPHQKDGVKFMWDTCFESIDKINNGEGTGCILAHCMGLGKTFQAITLAHTVLVNERVNINTIMVVCPSNTVYNWVDEFDTWQKCVHSKKKIKVYKLAGIAKYDDRLNILKLWHEKGGVLIISYQLFLAITSQGKNCTLGQVNEMKYFLLNPGPDVIVCDEGHILKRDCNKLAVKMQFVRTKRRIILTGTPVQNNLYEYHCMIQFVKPNLLGTKEEFCNRFVNPITNGQYYNSTDLDVNLMKRRTHVLYKIMEDKCVQRRDYIVLTPFLPPKEEYVIFVRLSEIQEKMYKYFLENLARNNNLLTNYHLIQQLVSHPKILEEKFFKEQEIKNQKNLQISTNFQVTEVNDIFSERSNHWWKQFVSQDELEDYKISYKMIVLFAILKECENLGDKLLVFSQSLHSLTLIEKFLEKINKKVIVDFNFEGEWKKGHDYYRLDGGLNAKKRNEISKLFNDTSNKRLRLILISTKAGGLGINLIGANRAIIFEPSWNPSNDVQSSFRIFRFGQKKPCYVYRLLSTGTMEQKIYNRQITKLALAYRVLDEHQIDRHYENNDLTALYTYQPYVNDVLTMVPPKDRVLADVIRSNKDYICNFIEHDSLLQNKEDEKLDESERNAAWEEYQKEKDNPVNDTRKGNQKKRNATNPESKEADFLNSDTQSRESVSNDDSSTTINSTKNTRSETTKITPVDETRLCVESVSDDRAINTDANTSVSLL